MSFALTKLSTAPIPTSNKGKLACVPEVMDALAKLQEIPEGSAGVLTLTQANITELANKKVKSPIGAVRAALARKAKTLPGNFEVYISGGTTVVVAHKPGPKPAPKPFPGKKGKK